MSDTTRYLRLTDYDNRGIIVKQQGREFFGIQNGEWKRRGLSVGYFLPDAPEYECYEEIAVEEANKLIASM